MFFYVVGRSLQVLGLAGAGLGFYLGLTSQITPGAELTHLAVATGVFYLGFLCLRRSSH